MNVFRAEPPTYAESEAQVQVQASNNELISTTASQWSSDIQRISATTGNSTQTVIRTLVQRLINEYSLPANFLTENIQSLRLYEYCEPQWLAWAADIEQELDLEQKEKVHLLFADFRALLAGNTNNNDQLKPLYTRLRDKGWKGQDYISQSILTICQNYRHRYSGSHVSLMRTIIKDLLETGVIRDPELVDRILMLPSEGMLNKDDTRVIDKIGIFYEKAVNNGTIGYDRNLQCDKPLLKTIKYFLYDVSINPEAQDLFLIYSRHHRSRYRSYAISLNRPVNEILSMINVVCGYVMPFATNTPTWLIYLLKDAISSGLFEDPKQVLARLCSFLGVPPTEPEASVKTKS